MEKKKLVHINVILRLTPKAFSRYNILRKKYGIKGCTIFTMAVIDYLEK